MLYYLVTSKPRRRLLELLWLRGERGSVSELARLAGVSFRSAHKELNEMLKAGLAARSCVGNATVFEATGDHPQARVLRELLRSEQGGESARPRKSQEDQELRSWLKAWGAPLSARSRAGARPPLEKVLARAAGLARRDASVARSLPVCFWKNRSRLDLERLRGEAQREGEKQTLGFFLEMAGLLGNDPELRAWAEGFRDQRVRRDRYFFFDTRSALARQLARERTPVVAKKWHFLMNLSQETFASTFEKFRTDAEVSG
jgi:hypothetical protein